MRRRELSYVKGATLRRGTYFLYLQCSCHFHMRLFSANSTAVTRCSIQVKKKGTCISFIAQVRGLTILWSELRTKSLHWRINRWTAKR